MGTTREHLLPSAPDNSNTAPPDSLSLLASASTHTTHAFGLRLLSPQFPFTFCRVSISMSAVSPALVHFRFPPLESLSFDFSFFLPSFFVIASFVETGREGGGGVRCICIEGRLVTW